jgi:hypothetical protein
MCDPEFRKSAEFTEGWLPNRSADTGNGMLRRFECMESFAHLVSNYEGFRATVLRYGLLNGQSGSFFSSFRPHVRATLRLTA